VLATSTIKDLSFSEATRNIDAGGAFVDLRPVQAYLDVHIHGSLSLLYERGPGFQSRARDCIPLKVPLVLLDSEEVDMVHAAASLRGRGFKVPGKLTDGVNEWARWYGTPASTEVYRGPEPRQGLVLDVSDPGAGPLKNAMTIPVEQLWAGASKIAGESRIFVAGGRGVRAALAVGILERAGAKDVVYYDTLA
jgi:rhodanese-related sulfurtransferase